MKFIKIFKYRLLHFRCGAPLILFLCALIGCSNQTNREWAIDEIITKTPMFNGGRLVLSPDSDYSNLGLELTRNSSGIHFYINLFLLQAPSWKENPACTSLTILFENQEPWMIHPYLLEGGQRLLLPGDVADILVQAILDNQSFTIQIGRSQINVIPTNFAKVYQQLLKLPIEN